MEALVSYFGEYMWVFWLLVGLDFFFLLAFVVLIALIVVDYIRY